jgi:L-asparaginase/Glu-tRNA(Gln) amidotransferase subunit D
VRTFSILFVGEGICNLEKGLREHLGGRRPQWALRFARTPADARQRLAEHAPDGVVLDLHFTSEEGEGLSFLQMIRRELAATPVILVCHPGDARGLREAFLSERATEDLTVSELGPEGVLFSDELTGEGALDQLEERIADGLRRCGRVDNETAVLITHGTDTMAWGFAYLHYALHGLTSNVAMTGSQIPLGGYFSESDALGNLRTAVLLLNRLRPPRLFAVFNNGRSVFSGRLTKYRKWDADAFEGRVIASAASGEVQPLRKNWVYIPYSDQRLRNLHLVRTGGTIESQRDGGKTSGLKPTGDFVWKYITGSLGEFFEEAKRHDLFALDSSNMCYEEWATVARAVEAIGVAQADTRFDPTVKPVFCNPFFTTLDYRAQFAACGGGAILAGYGGGNANVRKGSAHSILPALKASVEAGTFVAVTSQVPLEPYDAEYETGLALLEAGGVPCGDLPLADAQVKLSYLLGHQKEVAVAASSAGLETRRLMTAAFLSGVTMRRAGTFSAFRDAAGHLTALRVLPQDPFVSLPFDEALDAVLKAIVQ